jgi:putative DNA primase/helicase
LNESSEKRRIGGWLKTYSEKVKGAWVNNRADTASVNAVFSWVVNQTAVDPLQVNPGGLNCSNGVVKINPDGSHLLVLHDPKQVYTYVGCRYDPDIDATDCDRLLECLEPSQREIFLRTAAAALNLKLVRSKLTGRGVKGLLCHGEGSNGKDTLRAVLAAVFGRGMTGRSLSDFKSYDMGRKFALAGIEGSICNWASENTSKVDLDNIQSLKQFITGDPIDIERKGKDSYEYKSAAIFFANCNKLPSITGGTSAIDDRYGILRFDKTYARNADPSQGELEADPRFKDDEKFILEQVAPAMLNKLLERLPLLLTEGIDYKATKDAMREAQEESRHLWQFAREVGLEVQSGGRVWVKDLWQQLQDWYEDAGILEKEYDSKGKEKLVWNELSNKYDAPVKAVNQLYSRLCEIFPKLTKHRCEDRDNPERRGQKYLLGIGLLQNPIRLSKTGLAELAVDTARVTGLASELAKNTANPVANPVANPQTLTQSAANPANPISSPFTEICNLLSQLTDSEWQKLADILTQSQPLPKKVTPEDAQKIRDIALVWWLEYYPEQMQSLLTQMYGRQAPGTKYDLAILAEWLEGEDDLIRDRITQLIHRRKS